MRIPISVSGRLKLHDLFVDMAADRPRKMRSPNEAYDRVLRMLPGNISSVMPWNSEVRLAQVRAMPWVASTQRQGPFVEIQLEVKRSETAPEIWLWTFTLTTTVKVGTDTARNPYYGEEEGTLEYLGGIMGLPTWFPWPDIGAQAIGQLPYKTQFGAIWSILETELTFPMNLRIKVEHFESGAIYARELWLPNPTDPPVKGALLVINEGTEMPYEYDR